MDNEKVKRARIRTGALIGCDFHYCRWTDNGEIFTVEDFMGEGRKKLIADGYGSKADYGNGVIYAKEEDLIFVNDSQLFEPKPDKLLTGKKIGKIATSIKGDTVWLSKTYLEPYLQAQRDLTASILKKKYAADMAHLSHLIDDVISLEEQVKSKDAEIVKLEVESDIELEVEANIKYKGQ